MNLKNHFADLHLGKKRVAQEDSIGELLFNKSKYGNVYILCDGMGGHEGGKMASETAVNSIIEYFSNTPSDSPTKALKEAIEFANIQIFGKAQTDSQFKGMGTTCCVLLEKNNLIYVAHVGDSRIYISSNGKFARLTKDHSFVQGLFDNGQISEEEMETHPRKNELTQALGVSTEVHVEVCSDPILAKKGDTFLICSDGLCGLIEDNKIYDIVNKGKTNSEIGNNLIDAANNAGGNDNISVIYINVNDSPHATSQFKHKNNIEKENLTKTMLFDTDQRVDILAKKKFPLFKMNKNIIFISAGILLISLLMFIIIPNIEDKNNINIELSDNIKEAFLSLPLDKYEASISINDQEVNIFYYSFKKDEDWSPEKKFTPLIDKVKENHIMNTDIQEFYWNNEFLNYKQYKEKESDLYNEDILENSFIFIRVDKLVEKPNKSAEFDPYEIEKAKEKEKIKQLKKKAKENIKAAEKKKAQEILIKKEKEKEKINEVHLQLKSYLNDISEFKNKINDLNLKDEKTAKLLDDANANYKDQESKFFEVYDGYEEIPSLLPSTNIPKDILGLQNFLNSKIQKLKIIVKNSSNNYTKAETIQNAAAAHLNSSMKTLKLIQDLKNDFKVKYNINDEELLDICSEDLEKIGRAAKDIKVITNKSDNIKIEFNSIKKDLKDINQILEKSTTLIKLIKDNVEIKQEKKRGKK